jgi:hypothetical protein
MSRDLIDSYRFFSREHAVQSFASHYQVPSSGGRDRLIPAVPSWDATKYWMLATSPFALCTRLSINNIRPVRRTFPSEKSIFTKQKKIKIRTSNPHLNHLNYFTKCLITVWNFTSKSYTLESENIKNYYSQVMIRFWLKEVNEEIFQN